MTKHRDGGNTEKDSLGIKELSRIREPPKMGSNRRLGKFSGYITFDRCHWNSTFNSGNVNM